MPVALHHRRSSNQRALEFGHSGHDDEHHLAHWRGRVQLLGQAHELDALGLKVLERAEQMGDGPGEAMAQHVAFPASPGRANYTDGESSARFPTVQSSARNLTVRANQEPNSSSIGAFNIAAHELGHSYGLVPENEAIACPESSSKSHTLKVIADGYWLAFQKDVNPDRLPGPIDFGAGAYDYMNCYNNRETYPGSASAASAIGSWSTPSDFITLFKKFTGPAGDPEVLLVSGTITQTNVIQLGPSYRSPTGFADTSTPGNGAILVKDLSGNVVAQFTFPVTFTAVDSPITEDNTDSCFRSLPAECRHSGD